MLRNTNSAVCAELEKSNISLVTHGTLSNIELTPTLKELIVAAQKQDKGIKHI
jgi:hypothetical protein